MKMFKRILGVLCVLVLAASLLTPAFSAGEEMTWPNNREEVTVYAGINEVDYDYYEAEDGELLDRAWLNPEHAGYHGEGCVAVQVWDDSRDSTSGVAFTVDGGAGGERNMLIGYNSGFAWAQRMNVIVNGVNIGKVYFPTIAPLDWTVYGAVCVPVTLKEGENVIEVRYSPDDYPCAFNLDFIAIEKEGVEGRIKPGETTFEAAEIPDPTPEPTPEPTPDPNKINKVTLQIENKEIKLESLAEKKTIELDAAPMIKDDSTYIPVRGLFESLGATIEWIDETKTVNITLDETVVEITVGSRRAKVDGQYVLLNTPPFINPENNRTLIPLRFVSESLGFGVEWFGDTRTIDITVK